MSKQSKYAAFGLGCTLVLLVGLPNAILAAEDILLVDGKLRSSENEN